MARYCFGLYLKKQNSRNQLRNKLIVKELIRSNFYNLEIISYHLPMIKRGHFGMLEK
jgi:hypothetical protein